MYLFHFIFSFSTCEHDGNWFQSNFFIFEINLLSFALQFSINISKRTSLTDANLFLPYTAHTYFSISVLLSSFFFFLKTDSVKYHLTCQVVFQYLEWSSLFLSTKRSCVVTPHKCMIAWKCSTQRVSKFYV